MREQREGSRFAERKVDQRRQFFALGIGKFEPLGAHGNLAIFDKRAED